jgi:LuxR family quorum-sensing system transcriptional regulator CciR
MRIAEFIEQSNAAETPDEVFRLFCSAVAGFGYDRVAFAAVTVAAQEAMVLNDLKPVVVLNFPEDWREHWFEKRYYEIDPILALTPGRGSPFLWDDVVAQEPLSTKQKLLFHESKEAGLHNGLSVPVHGPRGESYVVSLATDDRVCDHRPQFGNLQILATQFLLAYSQIAHKPAESGRRLHLTERERECLTWTARGKSAWAISEIIGVSEHTVNFHLKGVMRKLDTANRVAAVVVALRLGLILP